MHKSKIHVNLILILLLTTFFSISSYTPSTQANPTTPILYIDPPSTTVNATETFNINATIKDVTDLAGWELKLYYRNSILAAVKATEGPFLKQGGSTAFFTVDFNNNYNTTHGRIWLTCTLLGNVSGVNGSGTLATITFQAVAGGNTALHLADTVLGDSQANPINHTTNDGEVTVIGVHDLAVTNVNPLKTIVGQSYTMHINVTVENQGDLTETFNLTLYANTTAINQTEITLTSGASTTITLIWNTTDFAKGNHTISAYAWPIQGETDTADNTYINGLVLVTIPGDVDGDFDVDIYDVVKITGIYGSKKTDPEFNPNSDLDDDDEITIYDVVRCTSHYGDTDP
ncbi:hypothetical protein DRO69_08575 [Candidatus Bathyarchaeota archaeon]|nr:MAG: hypothetical protein DRO69_08575 [Candidatus Bathyarchaeota archaeon]